MGVKVEAGVSIHNVMRVVARNAETMEIEEEGIAYNIVLDRAWDRICNFNSYFDNIVFGKGAGTPIASRSTLFSRVGSKPAVQESLVRDYPTSVWTKTCRLGTEEFNGNILTEIGISNETSNINTHAMIADSEGNPLSVEKTNLRIIDLYATVFVNVYDVDSGLFFYGNGLRDYLTGAGAPGNTLGISQGSSDDMGATINGAKIVNVVEKTIEVSGRFNVGALNAEIGLMAWHSIGLGCKLPRTGVFSGKQINGKQIGVGDGSKTKFELPQRAIKNLALYVDGIINSDWVVGIYGDSIDFATAPADTLIITADYFCNLVPKTVDNVFDVIFKIKFDGNIPTPVVPPTDFSNIPGAQIPIGGDSKYGFYGEVLAADFITGEDLCNAIGLTAGVLQNSDANWLKFAKNGAQLLLPMKTFRHTVSYNDINAAGAVWGKLITIGNNVYVVRLLSTVEWDQLMYPVHVGYGQWAQFTDAQLNISGIYTWTSTPQSSDRILRGSNSVSYSRSYSPSVASSYYGFRPVLEFLYTLPSGL